MSASAARDQPAGGVRGGAGDVFADALRAAGPGLLYGLRLVASVALALFVAYKLELQEASWAGTTAVITCQPTIGASLRKGRFRAIGTVVGAVAVVLLTIAFPQSRVGLLVGIAVWSALSGAVSTLLRNNAAYAAALAGYTAVIVFADATGSPGETFILAVTRATEIGIGIASAGLVLAATDRGTARRRVGIEIASVIAAVAEGLTGTLGLKLADADATELRRDLIRRVIALDPMVDEALGESSEVRYRRRTLQAGLEGLFGAISAWRGIATHLGTRADDEARRQALAGMPSLDWLTAIDWCADPAAARAACAKAAERMAALPAASETARLLLDRMQEALRALGRAANGLALVVSPGTEQPDTATAWQRVPDVLPALVNGLRALLAILVAELIWIETAWSDGQVMVIFVAVAVILFSPRAEQAYGLVVSFALGSVLAAALAALVNFAVLPQQYSFAGLIASMGLVLVPLGALSTGNWHKFFFFGAVMNFTPLLAPENMATYEPGTFLNSALAIVAGTVVAAVAMRLLPPVAPAWRVRRLLMLTLRDLRRLSAGGRSRDRADWLGLVTSRLAAMPETATALDRARLVASFSIGEALIWLRRLEDGLPGQATLGAARGALAAGDIDGARASFARFAEAQDRQAGRSTDTALRARAEAFLIAEALGRHADFFAGGAVPNTG